ncbi:sulfatase [Ruficoccus amylovorans]|uniref:Sulfatase n=1 Tax=Ruficoccus amylovorans TaxID=1804625 RepID=A0A842HGD3_9BACT|nr:sulfatase [Ruficoccus amylovorans]MBC2595240.1 sulfatase [Ruficoccus amylovorans]
MFSKQRANRAVLLVTILSACTYPATATPPPERPNILFIATDDLRNDLGCYGNDVVKTPNLDALSRRGVLFTNAYAQQALCNPSRASLMTGMRPDTTQVWNLSSHFRDKLPDIKTLPQWFKEHGYTAIGIGKIYHNHGRASEDPLSWSQPQVMHVNSHYEDIAIVNGQPVREFNRNIKVEKLDVPDEAYFDGRIAQLAITRLRELKAEAQPFFLAVGFWKPHLPFNAPRKYWDLYDPADIGLPSPGEWPQDAPQIAWHNSRELLGDNAPLPDDATALELRHGYYAAISYLDAQVGKVLDELEALGLADNTIVVFWSDHGFHLGEQALWCKTSNFELDTRAPLIIAVPENGYAHGDKCTTPVELLDIYPTLVQLGGLPLPSDLEGQSLVPLLKNPEQPIERAAFSQHPRPAYLKAKASPTAMGYTVRTSRHRYTEWREWENGMLIDAEFYDYDSRLTETRNLINDPDKHEEIEAIRKILHQQFPPSSAD